MNVIEGKRAAVLFDLDGTLTNPFVGITNCIRHAMERMGRPAPSLKAMRAMIGPPLHVTFAELLETNDKTLVWEAVGHYRERYQKLGKFENELIPGIPETLAACVEAGYFLSVATSKVEHYSKDILEHFDLATFFDALHGSAPNGDRSDKTALIAHILMSEPIDPKRCVMIGDRRHDIEGAAAHDLPAIGVLWGFGDRAELERAGAARIASHPGELPDMIKALIGD